MTPSSPPYADLLDLIADRATAFRTAVAAADLTARVPGCPEWTVNDLVAHLGAVHRFWATTVAAGPAAAPPTPEALGDRTPHGDLLTWSAESTTLLLDALRTAPPERACWTWWSASGAPQTAQAVARHQVHEAAVHTFDAQEAAALPEPIPAAAAVDGIPEFLQVTLASGNPWPHKPARIALTAVEGPHWLLDLTPAGITLDPAPSGDPLATLEASASDLLLALYRRIPPARITILGNPEAATEFFAWL